MNITIHRNGENYGPYTLEQVQEYLGNGTLNETDLAWQEGMSDWLPLKEVISPSDLPPKPKLPPPPPVANPLATNLHGATPETTQLGIEARAVTVKKGFFTRKMGVRLIITTLGIIILLLGYHYRPNILKTDKELFAGQWHSITEDDAGDLTINITCDGNNIHIESQGSTLHKTVVIDGIITIARDASKVGASKVALIEIDDKTSPFYLAYVGTDLYFDIVASSGVHPHKLEAGLVPFTENSHSANVIGIYKHDTGNQVYETITLFDDGSFTYDDPDYVFKHDGGTYTVDHNKNIFFSGSHATVFAGHGQISPEEITFPWYSFERAQ